MLVPSQLSITRSLLQIASPDIESSSIGFLAPSKASLCIEGFQQHCRFLGPSQHPGGISTALRSVRCQHPADMLPPFARVSRTFPGARRRVHSNASFHISIESVVLVVLQSLQSRRILARLTRCAIIDFPSTAPLELQHYLRNQKTVFFVAT